MVLRETLCRGPPFPPPKKRMDGSDARLRLLIVNSEAPLSLERFGSRCLRRRQDAVFCPRIQLPNHQEQLHPAVMTAPSPGLSTTAMLLSAGFPGAPRWLLVMLACPVARAIYGPIRATSHQSSFAIPDEYEDESRCETEHDRGIPSGWGWNAIKRDGERPGMGRMRL